MTQLKTSSLRWKKYLLSLRGVTAIKVPQNEEIFGGGKNGKGKGVGSAIHRKRANKESIKIKK